MSLDILQPRPSKMRTMPLKTNPKNNQKQLSNQLMRRKRNKIYLILFVNEDKMGTSWSGGLVFITAGERREEREERERGRERKREGETIFSRLHYFPLFIYLTFWS
uniref:Uncharacterized protein n=1 Tax=Cacopsylla melanoneura TaxID=428564 RepID=A0A8D8Y485_9HEMI